MTADNHQARTGVPPEPPPPGASSAFRWCRETWGYGLRCEPIELIAQHVFTSAQLRLPADAGPADHDRAWRDVAETLGTAPGAVMRVRQVHGRGVRVVHVDVPATVDASARPDADAVVANVPGLVLGVLVADCVPLLAVDPRAGAAAAIHAGWRGTCGAVTRAAVDAMREAWGTRPQDLVAAIGPSIGPDDYEVGEEVIEAFLAAGHAAAIGRWFRRAHGRLHLDLWRANRDQLVDAGVPSSRIFTAELSTVRHAGWLESFRRDGPAAGRMAAAVVVPGPRRSG